MKRPSVTGGGLTMGLAMAAALLGGACSSSSSSTDGGTGGKGGSGGSGGTGGAQSLYDKYGGAPTIAKVVDDAVAGLLADCEESPYFAVVGTPNHDSVARLKSCLRLQFTVLLGGPGAYPGVNDEGDTCVSMSTIHAGLGIPSPVYDKFVADLGGVLTTDGVSSADVTTIAGALTATTFKNMIVSTTPVQKSACDGGAGQ